MSRADAARRNRVKQAVERQHQALGAAGLQGWAASGARKSLRVPASRRRTTGPYEGPTSAPRAWRARPRGYRRGERGRRRWRGFERRKAVIEAGPNEQPDEALPDRDGSRGVGPAVEQRPAHLPQGHRLADEPRLGAEVRGMLPPVLGSSCVWPSSSNMTRDAARRSRWRIDVLVARHAGVRAGIEVVEVAHAAATRSACVQSARV